MNRMKIPENIRSIIGTQLGQEETIGMSAASVQCYDTMVLKAAPADQEAANEAEMLRWLRGKLPVPELLAVERQEGTQYLLMSRAEGAMSCDEQYLEQPEELARMLAEGLRMLWQVDTAGCPTNVRLEQRLRDAEYLVQNNLVDMENVDEETFGEGGFADPAELLNWLQTHQPEEDLVLTHGDYCLPNIFLQDGRVSAFIDLGKCGVADRYQDIALCYRSLRDNLNGSYGGKVYDFDPEKLFEYLGIEPDREKMRYYLLLDELY